MKRPEKADNGKCKINKIMSHQLPVLKLGNSHFEYQSNYGTLHKICRKEPIQKSLFPKFVLPRIKPT